MSEHGEPARRRWNHNLHYHRLILDAVPAGARTALDVGCGDGLLAAELRERVPAVTGIDLDAAVLERARAEAPGVEWLLSDVLRHRFDRRFDVVASVAALHHLPDPAAGLRRFAELTEPGGVVAIVGIARSSRPQDLAMHAVGALQHLVLKRRHGVWQHSAPLLWPPPHSYATVRRIARETLPGAHFRLLPMWRYALIWRKPR